MRTWVVLLKDKSKDRLTKELLEDHIAFLREMQAQDKLILAGPFADNQQALLILRGANEKEVKERVEADPFLKGQYYGAYEIHEFYWAHPDNGWLMEDDQTLGNL